MGSFIFNISIVYVSGLAKRRKLMMWNVLFVKIIFKYVRVRQINHIDGNCAYFDMCCDENNVWDVKWMDMRTLTRALM